MNKIQYDPEIEPDIWPDEYDSNYSQAEQESIDRLDFAREIEEQGDPERAAEIRRGA